MMRNNLEFVEAVLPTVSERKGSPYPVTYHSQEGIAGEQPWPAAQTSCTRRFADEAAKETNALGGDFVSKLFSISTCADDDTHSYTYEGCEDEEDKQSSVVLDDNLLRFSLVKEEETSTVSEEAESPELEADSEALRVIPSVGSALHAQGECKPCAWFWKAGGCRNGVECRHCHLCGADQLRARKRGKQTGAIGLQAADASAVGVAEMPEPLKISSVTGVAGSVNLLPGPPGLCVSWIRDAPPGLPPPSPLAAQLRSPLPEVSPVEAEGPLPALDANAHLGADQDAPAKSLQEVIAALISTAEQQGHTMADLLRLLEEEKDIAALSAHSIGSVWHGTGQCRPCMWFWRPQGCENRADCLHCHLCPDGASKMRKKLSKTLAKQKKQERRVQEQKQEEQRVAALLELAYEQLQTMRPASKQPQSRAAMPQQQQQVIPPGLVGQPAFLPLTPQSAADAATALPQFLSAAAPVPVNPMPVSLLSVEEPAVTEAHLPPPPMPTLLESRMAPPPVLATDVPAGGLPSVGSALHASGRCRPCAWFWKPQGCQNGQACEHCHSCAEGALQARKKAKVFALRTAAPAGLVSW